MDVVSSQTLKVVLTNLQQATRDSLSSTGEFPSHVEVLFRFMKEMLPDHSDAPGTIEISLTGQKLTPDDLISRYTTYEETLLYQISLQHLCTIFEDFLSKLIFYLHLNRPESMPHKSSITLGELLKAPSAQDINAYNVLGIMAEKEAEKVLYRSPQQWFEYIESRFALGCPDEDRVAEISEIKATRDLLAHAGGVINDTYLKKSGKLSRGKRMEPIPVTRSYFIRSYDFLTVTVIEMSKAAIEKFGSQG